jgi:flagellar protein FlaD
VEEGEERIKGAEEEFMTPIEIQTEIDKLRGKVPSFILKDLRESVKDRSITKKQFEKISETIKEKVDRTRLDRRIDDMSAQVVRLTDTIESIGKLMGKGVPKEGVGVPKEGIKAEEKEIVLPFEKRVRLTEIKGDAVSSRVLIEWIKFLIEKVSFEGMVDILAYYVDLGWISAEVLLKILRYAKGLKSWQESTNLKPKGYLTPGDHIRSLLFIEELRKEESKEGLEEEISKVYHYGWRK